MEFGPRALGGRSILADPRDPKMRDTLNMKIKFREGFRPFAPSVLADKAAEWFDIDCDSPYMLLVAQVREGKRVIPSVTHVDNSARLQTVTREESPLYYDLIAEFEKITGVPIIINTSFNVRGEPIVCTPHDAYLCFMRTNMDHLVLGPLPPRQEGAAAAARGRGLADAVRAGLSEVSRWHSRNRGRSSGIIGELWAFMRVRKKWWLGPIVLMLAPARPAGGLHPGLGRRARSSTRCSSRSAAGARDH